MSEMQLARRLECSAMTVSRWERGVQPPNAESYIKLGKLAGKKDCWSFWEHAGLRASDFPSTQIGGLWDAAGAVENTRTGTAAPISKVIAKTPVNLPLTKTVAGSHGTPGDKVMSLDRLPATSLIGAPTEWCPNPAYTILLHVHGHSMEPLISDADILAVDSSQTDRSQLDGKIVVVTSEEKGLCVSRLRRYEDVYVLQAENGDYEGIVLKNSGWQIVGKVLWWVSAAP